MVEFYVPTDGVESWRKLLAEPEKQWKTGYSARSLAYCWEEAQGFPKSVQKVFKECPYDLFHSIEFLVGIPEHKVDLPGDGPPSQNDIFVLAKSGRDLISITLEGKVSERFSNETVELWLKDASHNKYERINGMANILGLDTKDLIPIWYQLVHRTASALIEAKRFNTKHALMLVHSFSQEHQWFEDYSAFAALYGQNPEPDSIVYAGEIHGKDLYLGWVTGEKEYLDR